VIWARRSPEVAGSNPAPATKKVQVSHRLTWTFSLGESCVDDQVAVVAEDPIVYPSH
jgi:hypothetical protein